MQPFDKSESLFPVKRRYRYLSHCAIGPMYAPAADAAKRFIDSHCQAGRGLFAEYGNALTSFRENTRHDGFARPPITSLTSATPRRA